MLWFKQEAHYAQKHPAYLASSLKNNSKIQNSTHKSCIFFFFFTDAKMMHEALTDSVQPAWSTTYRKHLRFITQY